MSDTVFEIVKKEVKKLYKNLDSVLDVVLVGKGLTGLIIEVTSGDNPLKPDEIENALVKVLKTYYKEIKIDANCGFRGS